MKTLNPALYLRSARLILLSAGAFACAVSPLAAQSRPKSAPEQQSPAEKAPPPGTPPGKADPKAGDPKAKRPMVRVPGASIPEQPAMRARLLKDLYAILATAEDAESANVIADAIERVWMAGTGDTVKLLLERALKATSEKDTTLALQMLDAVIKLAPDHPEGFSRRAYVYYTEHEVERALGDLRRVLALDPNNYKALDGLGQILRETGQKKAALAVYRKLMSVHPNWAGGKSALDELEHEVEGQGS